MIEHDQYNDGANHGKANDGNEGQNEQDPVGPRLAQPISFLLFNGRGGGDNIGVGYFVVARRVMAGVAWLSRGGKG